MRSAARVSIDGLDQVARAPIVEEVNALPQTPQRRRAELVRSRRSLQDVVGELRAHVVQRQVRIKWHGLVGQSRHGSGIGGETGGVAQPATNIAEGLPSP